MTTVPLLNTAHVLESQADDVIPETNDAGSYAGGVAPMPEMTLQATVASSSKPIPEKTTVLIVGGGPAGSMCACMLARHGIQVVVLERLAMPRHHIGESYITSFNWAMSLIGLDAKLEQRDKVPLQSKRGAYIVFPGGRRLFTRFAWVDTIPMAWQCQRDLTDQFLLDHAESLGAKSFQQVSVVDVKLKENYATYERIGAIADGLPRTGMIKFDYIMDCGGTAGLLHKKVDPPIKPGWFSSMDNIACVSYWRNTRHLKPSSSDSDKLFIDTTAGPTRSWIWNIPVNCHDMSVGVVMNRNDFQKLKKSGMSFREISDAMLNASYYERKSVLGPDAEMDETVVAVPDRSHRCDRICGDNWFMVGDTAAFIDPFLSTGLHLATWGALISSACIVSTIKGNITKEEAQVYYTDMVKRQFDLLQWIISGILNKIGMPNCDNIEAIHKDLDLDASDKNFEVVLPALGIKSFKQATTEDIGRVMNTIYEAWEYFTCMDIIGSPEYQVPGKTALLGPHKPLSIVLAVWVAVVFGGFTQFFGDTMPIKHLHHMIICPKSGTIRRMTAFERIYYDSLKTAGKLLLPVAATTVGVLQNVVDMEGIWLRSQKLASIQRGIVGTIVFVALLALLLVVF